jgi:hypothetical protein
MNKRLTGFDIRKALELEISVEQIFQIQIEEEGDIAAKEIYDDSITHTSEIENIDDIFSKNNGVVFYTSPKEEIILNNTLKAYIYDFYISTTEEEYKNGLNCPIESDYSQEIIFLNTETLNYNDFCKNCMEAQLFLGKFEKNIFKRKFLGVGSFVMEEYALIHPMILHSGIHLLDFFIKDSNLVSSIGNIINANYEKDIMEQKEYFTEEEYSRLLNTVDKHKKILVNGFNLNDFK